MNNLLETMLLIWLIFITLQHDNYHHSTLFPGKYENNVVTIFILENIFIEERSFLNLDKVSLKLST